MYLYSALLCIVVHPKHFTIMWGGDSPQPPPVCSSIHLGGGEYSPQPPPVCSIHLGRGEVLSSTTTSVQHPLGEGGSTLLNHHQCAASTWGGGSTLLNHHQCAASTWGGGKYSPQPPPVCSIHLGRGEVLSSTTTSVQHPLGWCNGSHRTTTPVHSPYTSYRWRGERVMKPIQWMGIIKRPWLTRASGGNLSRTPGLHPYSLREIT